MNCPEKRNTIKTLASCALLACAIGISGMASAPRVISAVAVGPHQRVVTVEVGPESARTWLILGVTAQSITCLHNAPAGLAANLTTPGALENSSL